MRYCVIKNTTKVIDGSDNPIDILLQNAQNAGYTESEIEMLTEEEYKARKALESQPIPTPSLEERLLIAEETINVILGL